MKLNGIIEKSNAFRMDCVAEQSHQTAKTESVSDENVAVRRRHAWCFAVLVENLIQFVRNLQRPQYPLADICPFEKVSCSAAPGFESDM